MNPRRLAALVLATLPVAVTAATEPAMRPAADAPAGRAQPAGRPQARPATPAPAAVTPPAVTPTEIVPRGLVFRAPPEPPQPGETLTLERLLAIARSGNLGLGVSRAQVQVDQAGIRSAVAYPNPQIEFLAGDTRARRASAIPGRGTEISVAQPVENPALRRERLAAAQANAASAVAATEVAEVNLLADLRARWFEVLRSQEQLQAARDDLALTEQILERIRVRTRAGESPRFDLVRAETEVAVARRNVAAAQSRVAQNKALLRQASAPTLPADFNVTGEPDAPLEATAIAQLRQGVIERNPLTRLSEAQLARAERNVQVERALVLPSMGVRVLRTTEPDIESWLGGVYVNVPVFDRREGPIRAAQETLARTRLEAEQRRFESLVSFDAATQAYQASLAQLRALEGGILEGARNSLEIAEAAYRFGERGILEFLDAQRTFRVVRNDLINARFDLQAARIELERLAGLGFETR